MNGYHEHDIGDEVFVELGEGRYVPATVTGIRIDDSKTCIDTDIEKAIPSELVVSAEERIRRLSAFFQARLDDAVRRLERIERLQ